MSIEFIYPEFEVIRNTDRCISCRVCEKQCANEVHTFNDIKGVMIADETKCVNCQRCVSLCPVISKLGNTVRRKVCLFLSSKSVLPAIVVQNGAATTLAASLSVSP